VVNLAKTSSFSIGVIPMLETEKSKKASQGERRIRQTRVTEKDA